MRTVAELQDVISKHKIKKELLVERKQQLMDNKITISEQLTNTIKARELIHHVAQQTLAQLSVSIGKLVTQALHAVFDDPYDFKVDFVTRRNQTECDLLFTKHECDMDPLDASGGGAVDVASFALRCTFLALSSGRPILILDEPFKFLSVDLQEYGSEMLKTISEELNVQIIMVTHLPKIIQSVDKVIRVVQQNGVSKLL